MEEIEAWLKGTVLGIILLGALGSIFAIFLTRGIIFIVNKVVPLPYLLHRKNNIKRAYFLGGMHHHISTDEKSVRLISLLIFHLSLLIISLFLSMCLIISSVIILSTQDSTVLTVSSFLLVMSSFLSVYWAYHEFEFIYRSYLTFWKSAIKQIRNSFHEYEKSGFKKTDHNKSSNSDGDKTAAGS
jgi:hypothetical protein